MSLVFFCLFVSSAGAVLLKTITCAILCIAGRWFLLAYLLGDMALMMIIKIVRWDLRYFLNITGKFGIVATIAFRVGIKVAADFCFFQHARHPQELGKKGRGVRWWMLLFFFVSFF